MEKLSLKDKLCIRHVKKLHKKCPGSTLIISNSVATGKVVGATLFCDEYDYDNHIKYDKFVNSCDKIFVNVFPIGMELGFIE